VWVGSLLSAAAVQGMGAEDAAARGRIALRIYRRLAVPAFLASTLFGLARLGLDWRYYLVTTHFMHAKLLLVVIAIAAHHVVGARVKRAGSGSVALVGALYGLACMGAIVLAVVKPF